MSSHQEPKYILFLEELLQEKVVGSAEGYGRALELEASQLGLEFCTGCQRIFSAEVNRTSRCPYCFKAR